MVGRATFTDDARNGVMNEAMQMMMRVSLLSFISVLFMDRLVNIRILRGAAFLNHFYGQTLYLKTYIIMPINQKDNQSNQKVEEQRGLE